MERIQLRALRDCRHPALERRCHLVSRLPYLIFAASAVLATGASYRTENFVVTATDAQLARQIGVAAEDHRRALAQRWFGAELPRWTDACRIDVHASPRAPTNGQTSFVFKRGRATDWRMSIQGQRQSIFESVLPHEIGHTLLATYFGRPTPRWLEEGFCVAVEHSSSRTKLDQMVVEILRRGEMLTVERMFEVSEYPRDALAFYSQGYSLTRFLIEHGGEQKLIQFVSDGIDSRDWGSAMHKHYGYESLTQLQTAWVGWVLPSSAGSDSGEPVVRTAYQLGAPAAGGG